MTATLSIARDEILGVFKTKWDADTPAVNGGVVPPVAWEGVPFPDPSHDAAWARVIVRHNAANQATLSNATGQRRFEKFGIVTISIFTPLESGQGLVLAEALAEIAKAAYEGVATQSNVWFRDVRVNEVGADGPWFQTNVLAEFRYDELV